MDTKLLISFMEAAKAESFAEAAENLFMTQSALSKQIARLEKDLNTCLFDRTHRRAVLTQHGLKLAEMAPAIIESALLLQREVQEGNRLRLGIFPSTSQYGGLKLIANFCRAHPAIEVITIELENAQMAKALNDGIIDFAFCRLNDNSAFRNIVVATDTIALIVSASHPCANKSVVSLSSFKDENFIFLSNKTGLFEISKQCCGQAGFFPKIVFTGNSRESIEQLVEEGAGIAMIMKVVALSIQNPALSILDFKETVSRDITLSALKGRSFTAGEAAFWNYVAQAVSR